ncbi:hypothetical protein ON010_g6549 [Phytophthora cinnamomi]|nr:hypothetical protein ON010_g6549 [Phytophthora cinnamomi]
MSSLRFDSSLDDDELPLSSSLSSGRDVRSLRLGAAHALRGLLDDGGQDLARRVGVRCLQCAGHAAVADGYQQQQKHGEEDLERAVRRRGLVVEDVDAHGRDVQRVECRGRLVEPGLVPPELGVERHEQRAAESLLHELAVVAGRLCVEERRPARQQSEHHRSLALPSEWSKSISSRVRFISRLRRCCWSSASVSRKLPESNNDEEKDVKEKETTSPSATTPRRRKSPSNNENNHEANGTVKETPRRRSTRKQAATETASTQFVSRLDEQKADPATDEEDDSVLLRSTIAALAPQVREMAPPAPLAAETSASKKSVTLSYEEDEDAGVLLKAQSAVESTTSESSATISPVLEHTGPVQDSFVAKVVETGYLASILSVAAVVGSLVASQMLPRDSEEGTELWRRWLPFLTPVVALLLFFHQKDGRSSAKWVATGLSWRAAAELLLLIGSTPREFETMVAGSAVLANLSLLIALVSILRNGEHVQSKATLALLTVGTLTLFLSDSWVISTENSELESRVVLMSMAVLTIALSPTPTVSSEDDD